MSQHESNPQLPVVVPRPSLARTAVRWASNAAILAVVFVPFLGVLVFDIFSAAQRSNHPLRNEIGLLILLPVGLLVGAFASPSIIYRLISGLRRAWIRVRLQRDLHARLISEGFTRDATDSEAQALRAAFWREALREARLALATRQAMYGGPVDMFKLTIVGFYRARALLGVIVALSLIILLMESLPRLFVPGFPMSLSVFYLLLEVVRFYVVCSVLIFCFTGVVAGAWRLIEREELPRERRHVVALADLASAAGGLTLANDDDEALRGALSGDVASAGEIELVVRAEREGA